MTEEKNEKREKILETYKMTKKELIDNIIDSIKNMENDDFKLGILTVIKCRMEYEDLIYKMKEEGLLGFKYNDELWGKTRIKILNRDNYTCKLCGKKPAKHVHHLNDPRYFPSLAYEESNLILLCEECHLKKWHNKSK